LLHPVFMWMGPSIADCRYMKPKLLQVFVLLVFHVLSGEFFLTDVDLVLSSLIWVRKNVQSELLRTLLQQNPTLQAVVYIRALMLCPIKHHMLMLKVLHF